MIRLATLIILLLLTIDTLSYANDLNECSNSENKAKEFCVEDYTWAFHVEDTVYIKSTVLADIAVRDIFTRYAVISLGYQLDCNKGDPVYKHSMGSPNIIRPNFYSELLGNFEIGHKTDDYSRINGYSMAKAWDFLQKNPTLAVVCTLEYQTQAVTATSNISYTLGSNIFPLSVTYSPNASMKYSSFKSAEVLMKGKDYVVNQGGGGAPCIAHCTPLIVDLGQNGIHLGENGVGVEFDLLATSNPISLQWLKPNSDEAFIALDLNNNGIIDDGSELFGNGTPLVSNANQNAPNGFIALAQYDHPALGGNQDGYITPADEIWPKLLLWNDIDANGISTTTEISPLQTYSISQLEIIPKLNNRQDPAGNLLPMWSWAKGNFNSDKYKIADVYFKVL